MKFQFAILSIFITSSVFGDVLIYKSGKKNENVKTLVREKDVIVEFEDGHLERIPKDWLDFLKKQEVVWNRPIAPPGEKKEAKENNQGTVEFTNAQSPAFEEEYERVDSEIKKDEEERKAQRLKKFENEIAEIKLELKREDEENRQEQWSKTSAIRKSAIFPGWGQYYSGYTKKSYIIGGSFLFSALFLLSSRNSYQKAESNYRETTIPTGLLFFSSDPIAGYAGNSLYFESKKSSLNTAGTRLNLSILLFTGIYIFNLYDIYKIDYPFQAKIFESREPAFSYASKNDNRWNFEFTYTYRF